MWHDGHLLLLHTGDGYPPPERGQRRGRNMAAATGLCADGPQLPGCVRTGACLGPVCPWVTQRTFQIVIPDLFSADQMLQIGGF